MRDIVEVTVNINSESVVSLDKALEALRENQKIIDLKLNYILPLITIVDYMDISRTSFERNLLNNENVGIGVRCIEASGENFPRTKLFIDCEDLIKYLIKYCDLVYTSIEKINQNSLRVKHLKGEDLNKEQIEYLAKSLYTNNWKSNNNMQEMFNRSRSIIARLVHITESVSFSFPGSSRMLRRFVLDPKLPKEHYQQMMSNYKQYEKMIINN